MPLQDYLPLPPWEGPPIPRWTRWSRAKKAPKKTLELMHDITQFEIIAGVKATPERVVEKARQVGLAISLQEAEELLALRR